MSYVLRLLLLFSVGVVLGASVAEAGDCKCDKTTTVSPYSTRRPRTTTKSSVSCRDSTTYCSEWKRRGECQRNPNYMLVNCRKSCNICGSNEDGGSSSSEEAAPCLDRHAQCMEWSRRGECQRNPSFMDVYCAKSCKKC